MMPHMNTVDGKSLLTSEEVATLLRKSVRWVQLACKKGDIPSIKVGDEYRIKHSDLMDYLKDNTVQPQSA